MHLCKEGTSNCAVPSTAFPSGVASDDAPLMTSRTGDKHSGSCDVSCGGTLGYGGNVPTDAWEMSGARGGSAWAGVRDALPDVSNAPPHAGSAWRGRRDALRTACAETERSDPRRRMRTVPISDLGLEKAITSIRPQVLQSVAWSLCVNPWGRDRNRLELAQPETPCGGCARARARLRPSGQRLHAQHGALRLGFHPANA